MKQLLLKTMFMEYVTKCEIFKLEINNLTQLLFKIILCQQNNKLNNSFILSL